MKQRILTYTFALSLAFHTGGFAQNPIHPSVPPVGTYYNLKEALRHPKKTTHLELTNITTLPAQISQLVHLQSLKVSGGITSIPSEIGQLKELRELDLSSNQLLELPASIAQLKELHVLKVDHNQLTAKPDWLAQLPKLEESHWRGNPIPDLQLETKELASLPLIETMEEALKNPTEVYRLRLQGISQLTADIAKLGN
ncbi:MAG: hypothetical protein V4714_09595, partial [Bacteroidota bacterium]